MSCSWNTASLPELRCYLRITDRKTRQPFTGGKAGWFSWMLGIEIVRYYFSEFKAATMAGCQLRSLNDALGDGGRMLCLRSTQGWSVAPRIKR